MLDVETSLRLPRDFFWDQILCTGVEIQFLRSHTRNLHFGVEIHADNSGMHFQKSNQNHCFGVDPTMGAFIITLLV